MILYPNIQEQTEKLVTEYNKCGIQILQKLSTV